MKDWLKMQSEYLRTLLNNEGCQKGGNAAPVLEIISNGGASIVIIDPQCACNVFMRHIGRIHFMVSNDGTKGF
jgi:hypothetical protein